MDVALSLANQSNDDEIIEKAFGNVKYISDRSKIHIALHGALAGSELAALAVFGANLAAVTATAGDIGIDVGIAVNGAIETGMLIVQDAVTGMNTASTANTTDVFEAFMDAVSDSIVVLASNLATTFNSSVLVSGVIPQITAILGRCAGYAVYGAALTDFTIMVDKISQMYITGPKVIKEIMGQEISFEELGGAKTHNQISGPPEMLN